MRDDLTRDEDPVHDSVPRDARDQRRFEAYCRWSLHIILMAAGLASFAGTVRGAGETAIAAGWERPMLWWVLAVAVQAVVVWTVFAVVVTELYCRERSVPRWMLVTFGVLSAGLCLGPALLTTPAMIRQDGAGPASGLGPVVLAGTVLVASLTRRWRGVLGLAAVGGVLLTAGYLLRGLGVEMIVALLWLTFWLCVVGAGMGSLTCWMIDVVRRLHRSRAVAADLAVAQERLRFSRDLHDVYGRTLSAVAVKSELAAELARRGDPRAVEEMLALRELAQTAQSDVRGIVRGYRHIDLADEIAGARSLLVSAGLRVNEEGLTDLPDRLTGPAAEALAWVVREGVTNVLRHGHGHGGTVDLVADTDPPAGGHAEPGGLSAAEQGAGRVRLRIMNSAADRDTRADRTGEDGTGLHGLRERLEAVGGSLEAGRTATGFRLSACVPASSPAHTG